MRPFIRRQGKRPDVKLDTDEVTDALRAGLYDLLAKLRERGAVSSWHEVRESVCRALRIIPQRDNWSEYPNVHDEVQGILFNGDWLVFYTICEVAYRLCDDSTRENFERTLVTTLDEEGSPWTMKNGEIIPAFPEEVEEVLEEAATVVDESASSGVAVHLKKARGFLRATSRDPENAIKEAVSALEAAVKDKTGEDDIDKGLKLLKQQRMLTQHWAASAQAVFQYASQEEQVRHGSPDASGVTYEEARDVVALAAVLTQRIAALASPRVAADS